MTKVRINTNILDERMTLGEKLIASSGGIVACIDLLMVQTFLLYYYTDVLKINAAFVGTLFLVVRIISACAAPIFGIFIDRTSTPWGKYRPYYVIMGLPTAVFGFLTFTSFDLGGNGKYIYAIVTYLFYSLFISTGGVAKGAMGPTLTKNINDRVSMGLMGYVFGVTGAMLATVGAPIIIQMFGGNNEAKGYSITMAIFGFMAILLALLQCAVLKEKYPVHRKKDAQKYSMKQMFAASFHNRTAIIVLLLTLSINLSTGVRSSITLYYLKYYLHRPDLMAQMGGVTLISLLGGAMLSPIITKKVGIRKNLIVSNIFSVLSFFLIFIVPASESGITLFIAIYAVNGFFNGLSTPSQSTLMPNAIDYCEWKTGINAGAFMSSINSFVSTIATALSGVIVGISLTTFGYQADADQSQMALTGIKVLMSFVPAAASVISLSVIWLGNTEKQHERVVLELMERRSHSKI